MRAHTYPKWHVSTKERSLVPWWEASKAHWVGILGTSAVRRLSDVCGFHGFLSFSIPQRTRGWCADKLATPEAYLAGDVYEDVLHHQQLAEPRN